MNSSRFPGKPLARIAGRTMIEHVYQRARMCSSLSAVYVATCDEEIAAETERFGGNAIMTSASHQRASDRVAEVARSIDADIFVMVQGDEPMIYPEMIGLALQPMMDDASILCTNLAAPITSLEDFENPNTIKIVLGKDADALYFSRMPIPFHPLLGFGKFPAYKQVCIIPFRRDFLLRYTELEPTPLEVAESVDMLRALEHGYRIRIVPTNFATQAVDTPADLELVEKLMQADPLIARYEGPGR
jgi:3-deoxy-manno-octulosonate cytidylyltransferase (CMP-KDO synthetase)